MISVVFLIFVFVIFVFDNGISKWNFESKSLAIFWFNLFFVNIFCLHVIMILNFHAEHVILRFWEFVSICYQRISEMLMVWIEEIVDFWYKCMSLYLSCTTYYLVPFHIICSLSLQLTLLAMLQRVQHFVAAESAASIQLLKSMFLAWILYSPLQNNMKMCVR